MSLGKAMKILIADDHRLVIEAVKAKLSELEAGIDFVLAMSVDELLASASDDLDLAVIDLNMPGAEGQAHIDEIRRRLPAVPVIVLSGYEDPAVMRSVLERGVLGFIPKAYSPEVMLSAVRLVLAGGVYVPPMMLSSLPPGVVAGIPGVGAGADPAQRGSGAACPFLTGFGFLDGTGSESDRWTSVGRVIRAKLPRAGITNIAVSRSATTRREVERGVHTEAKKSGRSGG